MAEPQQQDDGIDIVKFFLGVMSLLTVFVALFAAYNWSGSTQLAKEVLVDQVDYEQIQKLAGNKSFLELVSRDKLYGDIEDVTSRDFGRHIEEAAQKMRIELQSFRSAGSGGGDPALRRNFDKQSYQFTIDQQPLEVIVNYLWYLQGSWPGLKIESLSVKPATGRRRSEEHLGWEATVVASIFRPKENVR